MTVVDWFIPRARAMFRIAIGRRTRTCSWTTRVAPTEVQCAFPFRPTVYKFLVNEIAIESQTETVESTVYATAQIDGRGVHRIQIELA